MKKFIGVVVFSLFAGSAMAQGGASAGAGAAGGSSAAGTTAGIVATVGAGVVGVVAATSNTKTTITH